MKFIANIKDHELTYGNPAYTRHHLSKWEGQRVTVEVKKLFNKRSISQNSLLWVWYDIIADYTGHSSEEIHQITKGLYCPKKEIILDKIKKKGYMIPKGTSELSVGEMVEFMLRITAMAADMGLRLPTPEEFKQGLDNATMVTE